MSERESRFLDMYDPPAADAPGKDSPVAKIDTDTLKALGYKLTQLFMQYRSDRRIQELRWLRNIRQYLGYYDPEVEKQLSPNRSRAYPKLTRVKVLTMLAQIMELMFPSDDTNWTIKARPAPDMEIEDIKQAIADAQARDSVGGDQPKVDLDYVMAAIQDLADKRAEDLTTLIRDQLEELGGDQSYDYVALNNETIMSAIQYGLGVLRGPFAREIKTTKWSLSPEGLPVGKKVTSYMPQFTFTPVWDFYPDLAAKRLEDGDGYFLRQVMSRTQVRDLAKRKDFYGPQIKKYLATHEIGNYRPLEFETELRSMGVKTNVNETKIETTKYEVIIWHGKVDGMQLKNAGADVPDEKLSDQLDAEIWMIDGIVIKVALNPWASLGVDVCTTHTFLFDRDDTAPIGFGLPNILRDTQMSISAVTRMMLDNASVIAGPILEMNTALLRPDQDLSALSAYKVFYRDDEGPTSQWPAVRDVKVDAHLEQLEGILELFMKMADMETFVTPAASGDLSQLPSEPFRNAAGASMLMGKASLPFKQIIRNFDRFTQSVIQSLIQFNRQFNPDKAQVAEYDVIARGATSLIAKEIRGIQIDQLVTTLTPGEMLHVNDRKLAEARFKVRDMDDLLVSEAEADRRKAAQDKAAAEQQQTQQSWLEANIREVLTAGYKNITQGQKNQAAADAQQVESTIHILEGGLKTPMPAPEGPAGLAMGAPPGADPNAGGPGGGMMDGGQGAGAGTPGAVPGSGPDIPDGGQGAGPPQV